MNNLKIEISENCTRVLGRDLRYSIHVFDSVSTGHSMILTYLEDVNGVKNFVCVVSDPNGTFQ